MPHDNKTENWRKERLS